MSIKPLLTIIKKNIKLLLRSKSSALIIILGPLFLILLLGIAFNNTNSLALNIGVYSEDYTPVVDTFIEKLSEKQYNIEEISSEFDCINQIKVNKLNACVIFPKNLDIEKGIGNNTITFYVDNSRINMVFIIIEALTSKFSEQSKEIAVDLTNTLLQKLESTRVEIFNRKPALSEMKKKNEESVKQIEQIKIDLDSLDISLNTNDFKMGTVNEKLVELEAEAIKIEQVQPYFSDVLDHLDDIESDVKSLVGSESTIDEINLLINNSKNIIQEANYLIDDQQTGTDKKISELKLLTKDINLNVLKVKNKIENVASSRNAISTKIDEVIAKILEVNNKINLIDESFKKIDENIGSIQITDADKIVSPIKTNIRGVETETTYLEGLFPDLLMVIIMFISILLSTSLVMMERNSAAYFRNKITPLSDTIFFLGNYLTSLIIVTLQVLIIVIISSLLFKIKYILPTIKTLPFILVIISLFSFIGILIGKLFRSEETAAIAAVSISTILLFLSDIIVPLGMVPKAIRNVIQYSPFILSSNFLKIGLKQGIGSVINQFWFILIYAVVLCVIIIYLHKLNTKRFLSKIITSQQKKQQQRQKQDLKRQKGKLLFK